MQKTQSYEGMINFLVSRQTRLFQSQLRESAANILQDILITARELAWAESVNYGERDIFFELDCRRHLTVFRRYVTQVVKYAKIAAQSDDPIRALSALQEHSRIIGTPPFSNSIAALPSDIESLESCLEQIEGSSQDFINRRSEDPEEVAWRSDCRTRYRKRM